MFSFMMREVQEFPLAPLGLVHVFFGRQNIEVATFRRRSEFVITETELKLMATAAKWAETICERGPLAVRAAKEAILRGLTMPLADGLRLEAFLSGTLRGTEDAVEGPKAFAEKRKPNFQAR